MVRYVSILAFVVALLVCALAAARASAPTTLNVLGERGTGTPHHFLVYGRLESPKDACLPGRTVRLKSYDARNRVEFSDEGTSSDRGAFALEEKKVNGGKTRLKVLKTTVGPRGHRLICGEGSNP